MALNTILSPFPSVDNNRPRWHCTTVVVTNTICLSGADVSLVQVSSLWTATALHRHIIHPTARVRARQGAARMVACLSVVGEFLILLTCHSWDITLWLLNIAVKLAAAIWIWFRLFRLLDVLNNFNITLLMCTVNNEAGGCTQNELYFSKLNSLQLVAFLQSPTTTPRLAQALA